MKKEYTKPAASFYELKCKRMVAQSPNGPSYQMTIMRSGSGSGTGSETTSEAEEWSD